MSDLTHYNRLAPKEVAQNLMPIFYRLKYQKSPSWFYGLTDADVRTWRQDNTEAQQIETVRALKWVVSHPTVNLIGIIRNMPRSNRDIHIFCKNFLDSLGYTGHLHQIEQLG